MTTPIAQGPVDVNVRGDLCDVCGRPPHVCDDPECVPLNATIAERERFLVAENIRLRRQVWDAYVEVRYVLAGLAGVALRVAPNDEHMDSVIGRLAKLETALTPNVEHNRRTADSSPGVRVDGPVGPHFED